MNITFTLNSKERNIDISPSENALALLRRMGMISVKNGCNGEGNCGVCTILLDGNPVNSCHLPAAMLDGRRVHTAESLNSPQALHIVQQAFLDSGMVQCGYCTPAMLLTTCALLEKYPQPTEKQIRDYFSSIICRCTGYQQIFDAITMASKRLLGDKDFTIKSEEFREDLRLVGKYSRKVDGAALLKSDSLFVEDFVKPNSLIMKVLWSPHAHALIKNIDTTEAEKIPGIIFIATHKNVPDILYTSAGQNYPEPSPYDQRLIDKKVRFVGDRVAAVAAETEEAADSALRAIKVEYELLKPVFSIADAKKIGAPRIHDDIEHCFSIGQDIEKNLAASNQGGIGSMEEGFAQADVILEKTYKTGHIQCTPLEPHVCYSYMEGDRLVVQASTQVPFHTRRIIARILGMKESDIRVIKARVGGGFGSKQDIVLEELCAFMTYKTGRPVFWRYNREEEFISSRVRFPTETTVKVGAKKDGTLTALQMDLQADSGPYGVHCLTVPMNACSKSLPLFRCPNMHFSVNVFYTNNIIAGAYQGYGAPAGSFAVQMAIYEMSKKLGISHMDFLRKNHIQAGDRLEILKVLGEGQEGIPQCVTSSGLPECLDRGIPFLEKYGPGGGAGGKVLPEDKDSCQCQSCGDHIKYGTGFAIIQQGSGLPGIDSANALVKFTRDGNFITLQGGADLGTGMDTVIAKVVAEELCVDQNRVSVLSGDTDATPFDVGAYASSGTYFSGTSALMAAKDLKIKILQLAAKMKKCPVDSLKVVYPGKVIFGDESLTFEEIALESHTGHGEGQLIGVGHFTKDCMPIPYGAHFARVAVDTRTGRVRVLAYHAFQDCGTPINPELALGQLYGGVLKSMGHAIMEEYAFDENGKCLNPNFTDYKVPTILDVPDDFLAETVFVEEDLGAFGAKSISEIATNGAAPSIAMAIHDATGILLREYPFTPEKVLRALREKEGKL